MDLAIVLLVSSLTKALAEERWASIEALHAIGTEDLAGLLRQTMVSAERTEITDPRLLAVFGRFGPLTAQELWIELTRELHDPGDPAWGELRPSLDFILREGPLARRLSSSFGRNPDRELIDITWRRLARGLTAGDAFTA